VDRAPGLSVRLKLTLSYAGFLMLAGAVLLAAVWLFLLRDLPEVSAGGPEGPIIRADLVRDFAPAAGAVLGFLLVFGLLGGWTLAGRMLAPLTRITDATGTAATGSLSHRIQLEGRKDEFRELADSFDAMPARLEAHVAEVAVAELALDDDERYAFVGHFSGVGVPELMWSERSPDARCVPGWGRDAEVNSAGPVSLPVLPFFQRRSGARDQRPRSSRVARLRA
jgi:HAMP domain-containing protein